MNGANAMLEQRGRLRQMNESTAPPDTGTVTIVAHDVGGIGGMESQLESLITRLLERGTHVVVVSRTLDLALHPRLTWHRMPGPSRPFTLAYPWFALVASVMLARRRPGVLHTTGAIVLNRADVCTVHYLHSGRQESSARAQRATLPYRLNAAIARRMSRWLERIVYASPSLSRTLVAVSERLESELVEQFPTRARSVRLIQNGVDTERFRPDSRARQALRKTLEIGEEARLALFLGSEWQRKGAEIAVAALVDSPSWQLIVVGRGDDGALLRTAEHFGVQGRLHLAGESTEPERYYAAADAFVLPSEYETFSLAAFEAAASGVPVVATDVGAVNEIVKGGGGILVERKASSVAAALNLLETRTEEEALVMSELAREVALQFGWDAVADQYISIYSESTPARHSRAGSVVQ